MKEFPYTNFSKVFCWLNILAFVNFLPDFIDFFLFKIFFRILMLKSSEFLMLKTFSKNDGLCWRECAMGSKCKFAHGQEELRMTVKVSRFVLTHLIVITKSSSMTFSGKTFKLTRWGKGIRLWKSLTTWELPLKVKIRKYSTIGW